MILPNKHIRFSESTLGLAGYLLSRIQERGSSSVDELWDDCQHESTGARLMANQSFDNLIRGVDLLYMMGIVELNVEGRIEKV